MLGQDSLPLACMGDGTAALLSPLKDEGNSNVYAMCASGSSQEREAWESPRSHQSAYCETRTKCYNFKDAVNDIAPYREAPKNKSIRHKLLSDLVGAPLLTEVSKVVFSRFVPKSSYNSFSKS